MSYLKLSTLIFCLFLSLLPVANASLIGQSVNLCFEGNYFGAVTTEADATSCISEGTAVVADPDVEFILAGGGGSGTARDVDLTADTVSLIYSGVFSESPDLFILSNLNWGATPGVITGLTLLTADPLGVSTLFTADSIGLLVNNPLNDAMVTFRIETSHVPIPAAFWLFASGLVGLFSLSRRKLIIGQ